MEISLQKVHKWAKERGYNCVQIKEIFVNGKGWVKQRARLLDVKSFASVRNDAKLIAFQMNAPYLPYPVTVDFSIKELKL